MATSFDGFDDAFVVGLCDLAMRKLAVSRHAVLLTVESMHNPSVCLLVGCFNVPATG